MDEWKPLAEGVNMGTRFMATKEAPIQQGIKDALVAGPDWAPPHNEALIGLHLINEALIGRWLVQSECQLS